MNTAKNQVQALEDNGFPLSRLMCGSKSLYRKHNPNSFPIFNANILSQKTGKKVWWGDLDLNKDSEGLIKAAQESEDVFYVLKEMSLRFENENKTLDELEAKKEIVWSTEKGFYKYEH